MKDKTIYWFENELRSFEVSNIPGYIKKLRANIGDNEVFGDLQFEGFAALILSDGGFNIEMQDSPDLLVGYNNLQFYAEVKHFREKDQDIIDDENMGAYEEVLKEIGNTTESEGKHSIDQVVDVAKKKIKQYRDDSPNLLVIGSSSQNCIDKYTVQLAIIVLEYLLSKNKYPGLEKLGGVLLWARERELGTNRNIYFYPLKGTKLPFNEKMKKMLNQITYFKPWLDAFLFLSK
jgi:hypothetical protein